MFTANNQISGSNITYDAAGNITNDGFHAYTYDMASRLIAVDRGLAHPFLRRLTNRGCPILFRALCEKGWASSSVTPKAPRCLIQFRVPTGLKR
jgi:hypothetical protein